MWVSVSFYNLQPKTVNWGQEGREKQGLHIPVFVQHLAQRGPALWILAPWLNKQYTSIMLVIESALYLLEVDLCVQ